MTKIPGSFTTKVLKRYMNDKRLAEFHQEYSSHLLKSGTRSIREPSASDQRIVSHIRKTKSYSITAEALGIKDYQIAKAMQRVVAWEK